MPDPTLSLSDTPGRPPSARPVTRPNYEEGESIPAPREMGPLSPWGGLSHYQVDVAESIHRAAPEIPFTSFARRWAGSRWAS